MAVYTNHTPHSPIAAVEFSPVSRGNFSFFYLADPARRDETRQWLTSPRMRQEIVAETLVGGKTVFVTQGEKTVAQILSALHARGDRLSHHHEPRGIDPWTIRGALGFTGQILQLVSSMMRADRNGNHIQRPKSKIDPGQAIFSISNLTANVLAMVFGAQKGDDIHRLRFLKEQFNHRLSPHLPDGEALPPAEGHCLSFRREAEPPKTARQQARDLMERHSVRIGEIGLRYFGAFNLAYPVNRWNRNGHGDGLIGGARASSGLRKFAGLGSMAGKSVAFFAQTKDPYHPGQKDWLSKLRQRYLFVGGGLVEAVSFGALAVDHFTNKETNIVFRGKERRDYIGGLGALMFVAGYIVRSWAKFGEKHVNMDELYAHITDSLAKMPPDKLPQLLADTAASVKDHFKDKNLDFGKVYTQIATDLYRFHHIAPNAPAQTAVAGGHRRRLEAGRNNAPEARHVGV